MLLFSSTTIKFVDVRSMSYMTLLATGPIHGNLANSTNTIFYQVGMAIPKCLPNPLHCLICIKHITSSTFYLVLTHLAAPLSPVLARH